MNSTAARRDQNCNVPLANDSSSTCDVWYILSRDYCFAQSIVYEFYVMLVLHKACYRYVKLKQALAPCSLLIRSRS